jgi:hypothetical protein
MISFNNNQTIAFIDMIEHDGEIIHALCIRDVATDRDLYIKETDSEFLMDELIDLYHQTGNQFALMAIETGKKELEKWKEDKEYKLPFKLGGKHTKKFL